MIGSTSLTPCNQGKGGCPVLKEIGRRVGNRVAGLFRARLWELRVRHPSRRRRGTATVAARRSAVQSAVLILLLFFVVFGSLFRLAVLFGITQRDSRNLQFLTDANQIRVLDSVERDQVVNAHSQTVRDGGQRVSRLDDVDGGVGLLLS